MYSRYIILLFICLASISDVWAEDCSDLELSGDITHIQKLNRSNKSFIALILADSIVTALETRGLADCPEALTLRLDQGESMEMEMKFQEALEHYYTIITQAEQKKLWDVVAMAYIAIARSYEFLGRPKDCRNNLDMAYDLIEREKIEKLKGIHSVRLSSYHRIFASKDTALVFATKALDYGRKYNDSRTTVDGHMLVGMLLKDIDQRIYHFRTASNIFDEIKDYEAAGFMRSNICSVYLREDELDSAAKALDSLWYYIDKLEYQSHAYYHLRAVYFEDKKVLAQKRNQVDSAYAFLQKSIDFERKARWEADQEEISQNAATFALQKEKIKAEGLKKASDRLKVLLSILSFLSIMIALFWFNAQKNRKHISQQNTLISERNAELNKALTSHATLLSEVHHRVKNNLQLVISLLDLQGNQAKDKFTEQSLFDISNKVRSIALIHEQLYSEGDFDQIHIGTYIESLTNHYKKLNHNNNPVIFDLDINDIYLNIETVLPIGIICSELLSNSFKYAAMPDQNLEILISVKSTDITYVLTYRDNGPGYVDMADVNNTDSIGMR